MARGSLTSLSDLARAATSARAQRAGSREVLTVAVDQVVSKEQIRKRFRKIDELAASLRAEGQQTPIIVYPKNPDGKYVILRGERRWRACLHAGIAAIDIIVRDGERDDLEETAGELTENIQRDDLTPLEIAQALGKFIDHGWSQKKISERIGKHPAFVSAHLSLLKLPDCVRELVDTEVCSDTETLNSLRLLYALDAQRCQTACTTAKAEGITRKHSRELLNDAKQAQQAAATPGTEAAQDTREHDVATDADEGGQELESPAPLAVEPPPPEPVSEPEPADATGADAPIAGPSTAIADWWSVRPDTLRVSVEVRHNDETHAATLMMDRVSANPNQVWVLIDRVPTVVPAACVRLATVTAE